MTELGPTEPERYTPPTGGPRPDTPVYEQTVVMRPDRPDRRHGLVAVGVTVVAIATAGMYALNHREGGDHGSHVTGPYTGSTTLPETEVNFCFSPAVARTFAGDETVTSSDPADWTKGVLLTIKPSKDAGYQGVRIGFHGPEGTTDDSQWSEPVTPDELATEPALMRTGHDAYTIVVESIADPASPVCNTKPDVAFRLTSVRAALGAGAIEPRY